MNQRVIKFRAWDKINHKWLFGDEGLTIQQIAALNYYELPIHGKDIEWLEYTGLLDKNGKEIFEGDIVKASFGYCGNERMKTGEKIFEVKWERACWSNLWQSDIYELHVLGNIHENPELIRQS